jgi:hypothetical protein
MLPRGSSAFFRSKAGRPRTSRRIRTASPIAVDQLVEHVIAMKSVAAL